MDERKHYDCEEARAHYHQVRRGDVTVGEMDRYDAHLADCDACQAFVLRMDGMLDAATTVDSAADAEIDRDDLFASIMGAIDEDATQPRDVPEPELRVVDDDLTVPRAPRRFVAAGLLLAAVIVAGLGVAMWMERAPDGPLADAPDRLADNSETIVDAATTSDDDVPRAVESSPRLAELESVESNRESVRIHATKAARVEISNEDSKTNLDLETGTVLVEFVPQVPEDESLIVSTGGLTVRVVGTIFYVSNDDDGSVVGVVTGKVEVTTERGESLFLTDGQEYDSRSGIRTTPTEQARQVARYVDVSAHKEQLEAERARSRRKSRDEPPRRPEQPDSKSPEKSLSVLAATLRDQASEAVRLRQYDDAAQLYEELIVELPSGHPAAMSARLDLSRIYMKQLDQPGRAVPHLKRFIVDRPDDPAAPSARETLCRILEARDETDPACSD